MNERPFALWKVTAVYNMFPKSQPIFFFKYKIYPSNLREIKMELLQLTNVDGEILSLHMEVGQGSSRQQAPRSIWCRGHPTNTHDSLGRHFLHPSTSSETQLKQPQLMPFPVCTEEPCGVISHSCLWLLRLPTFCQTPTNALSCIPPHQVQ